MTKALVAVNKATYGGVYYTDSLNYADLTIQPTWTRMSITGLANLLIKRAQFDQFTPYADIYVQLVNDNVYHYNGSSWDLIMDLATAKTLTGRPSGVMGYIFVDKATAGTVYVPVSQTSSGVYFIKSTDYGANWTVITVATGLVTQVAYGQAYGQYLVACFGQIYRSMWFSSNGGTSWTKNGIWVNTFSGATIKQDPHRPTNAYYHKTGTDYDLIDVTATTITEYQDTFALYNGLDNIESYHWIDRLTAGHQRIVRNSGGTTEIYSTLDNWTTFVDSTPTNLAITGDLSSITAAIENSDYCMAGSPTDPGGSLHIVYAFVGDNPTQAYGICGTNYKTAPYTNAIPCISGSYVADCGIYVGETVADKGIELFSVEMDAYDTDHTPMRGSQSSWRDMDADDNDLGEPASYSHAEDIQELTPQRHNPWPAASGEAPVSDGTKYIATDIATQAELDAHAGLATHHAAVTLAADADTLLGLNVQQLTLDTQTANRVFAGPTSGAAADPTFRAVVAADLGSGTANATKYLAGDLAWTAFPDTVDINDILDAIHEHATNEDLSGLCDGSSTIFILANEFWPETTAVYLNGLRQFIGTDYTENAGYDAITFVTAPEADDILIVDYILADEL